MKRIVLSGYYGFDNAGDEAVLAGLIKALGMQSSGREIAIEALSSNPPATRRDHRIDASHRMRLGAVMRSLSRADLLASGGGSLLQDTTSRHGIFYYLAIVRLAQILGKRTMFIAQGIGPLTQPRSRKLTASVANRLDAITVRDTASADLLREIGVNIPRIEIAADPALLLDVSDDPSRGDEPSLPRSGVAVALRPWQNATGALVSDLCTAWQTALAGQQPCFMSMQPAVDFPVNHQVAACLGASISEPEGDLWTQVRTIRTVDMVVGMRLHALILAAAAGAPIVAISYDPKVSAFLSEIGQEDAIYDIANPDPIRLAALLEAVWNQRAARATSILKHLPELRRRALLSAEIAIKLMG